MSAVQGLVPVLATPFRRDESIDEDAFARVVRACAEAGADGVMFPGFASEFPKLSDAERDALTEVLLDQAPRGLAKIVSIPDSATRLAVGRAGRAAELGATAINVLPPYATPSPPAELHRHLEAIMTAVDIPVVVQYAPQQTGASLSPAVLASFAAQHPRLVAVKVEAVPPGPFVTALRDEGLPAFVGYAGLHLVDALERGAIGVQPGSSFPELYRAILDYWAAGDRGGARELHRRLLPFLTAWMTDVALIVAVEKEIACRRGMIPTPVCRRPARPLDEFELASVDAFLREFAPELGG